MTWLEGKLAEFADDRERETEINANAPTLFAAVWERIADLAHEANRKGFSLKLNGNSERRKLDYVSGPTRTPLGMRPYMMAVSLSANRKAVEVSGISDGLLSFDMAPCADGIVCLHHDGQRQTPEEIARIIMARFLFPGKL